MADPKKELNSTPSELDPVTHGEFWNQRKKAALAYGILGITFFIVLVIGLAAIRDNRKTINQQAKIRNQQIALRNFNIKYVCSQINLRVIIPQRQDLERSVKQTDFILKALGFSEQQIHLFQKRQAPIIARERERLTAIPCHKLPVTPKHLHVKPITTVITTTRTTH